MDQDRALRLRLAAKMGDIVHTNEGVYQSDPCNDCKKHHRVSLSLTKQPPCPHTEAGMQYSRAHKERRLSIETAPLTTLLHKKGILASDTSSSRPFQPRLAAPGTTMSRSKIKIRPQSSQTARGRLQPHRKAYTSTSAEQLGYKRGEGRERGGITWNDIFQEGHLSTTNSWTSDIDGSSVKSVESQRRDLVREMYAQEEEALRLLLVKEKEMHNQSVRQVLTSDYSGTSNNLRTLR